MKRVYQKEPGDCFRACIASILGLTLEDVPKFHDTPNGELLPMEAIDRFQTWLTPYGYTFVEFGFSATVIDLLAKVENDFPDTIWILTGNTRQGKTHSAVFRGGCPEHDPACDPGGSLVTEPGPDGIVRMAVLALTPPK